MLERDSFGAKAVQEDGKDARSGRHHCLAKSKPGSYSHNCGGLFEMALLVVAVADAAKFGTQIGPPGIREAVAMRSRVRIGLIVYEMMK